MIPTDDGLLELAEAWRLAGRKVALATVVSTWGSSPRPAGSMLIVDGKGETPSAGRMADAVRDRIPEAELTWAADAGPARQVRIDDSAARAESAWRSPW